MASKVLPDPGRRWHAVAAASIGNEFEWFDFIIYGYFAMMIARLFFPAGNETASLLLTFASFGFTFIMRPFGAGVLGHLADRRGRKAGMTLSISMMMAGTAITACAPTLCVHRDIRADHRGSRAHDSGFFRGRRIRHCDGVSSRAESEAARS